MPRAQRFGRIWCKCRSRAADSGSGEEMERTKKSSEQGGQKPAEKKAYVKPGCVSEPIYETLALACGKMAGQSGICHAVPRRS